MATMVNAPLLCPGHLPSHTACLPAQVNSIAPHFTHQGPTSKAKDKLPGPGAMA